VVKAARRRGPGRGFYLALAAVAIAGIAALGYGTRSKTPEAPQAAFDPAAARSEGYVLGSPTAPVEIVEFADFECPACAQFATVTGPDVRTRIVDAGLARYRFYDFPLVQHRNSMAASLAAACAADQGKFWQMHDRIFQGQDEWNTQSTRRPKPIFERYAREVGLDQNAFTQCLDDERHRAKVLAHQNEGLRSQVASTPTFIVNGRVVVGAPAYDEFKRIVDSAAVAKAVAPAGARAADSTPAGR
jgi:protein-disulfide isomerase